jgi:hypothetical protein
VRPSRFPGIFNVITIASAISRARVGPLPIAIIIEVGLGAEKVVEPEVGESAQVNSKSQFRPSAFGFVRVARIATLKGNRKT